MGREARGNLRSDEGHKWGQIVTQARLDGAPITTLLKVLVALMAPAAAQHFRLVDSYGRPIYANLDTRTGATVTVKRPRRYEATRG